MCARKIGEHGKVTERMSWPDIRGQNKTAISAIYAGLRGTILDDGYSGIVVAAAVHVLPIRECSATSFRAQARHAILRQEIKKGRGLKPGKIKHAQMLHF